MKFHKRKIAILLCTLFILTILSSLLCSFTFRPVNHTTSLFPSRPTLIAAQNLAGIFNYQLEMIFTGRGSNFFLMYVVQVTGGNLAIRILTTPNSTPTISVNGSAVTFSGTAYVYNYNDQSGFYESSSSTTLTITSTDIYYCSSTIPATNIPTFTGFNPNANFGTSSFNSDQLYYYFEYIYKSVVERESREESIADSAFSSGYSEGESVGYSEGESVGYSEGYSNGLDTGYNNGYVEGLDQGYDYGFSNGYDTGYATGYREGEYSGYAEGVSEGHSEGYSEGYRDGYDDGYGAAEPGDGEVVTEIVYRDPVEINIGEIISGISSMPQNLIGSSFGFELFGINIAGLLTTLIVLAVGGFIVGLFLKKR